NSSLGEEVHSVGAGQRGGSAKGRVALSAPRPPLPRPLSSAAPGSLSTPPPPTRPLPAAAAAQDRFPGRTVAARGGLRSFPGPCPPPPPAPPSLPVPDVLVPCHSGRGALVGLACAAAAARRGSERARGAGASVCVSHPYLECELRRASGAEPEPEPSPRAPGPAAPAPAPPPPSPRAARPARPQLLRIPAPASRSPPACPEAARSSPGNVTAAPRAPSRHLVVAPGTCARCGKVVYPTEKVNCLDKYWHKGCFHCEVCKMALNMNNYKGYEKKPYCN
ncbi:LIM zinc-binding domain-containing Nebulette, partial [Galemys pyrenaicus]